MVTLNAEVDPSYTGESMEFVFMRNGAQLGSDTAATPSTVSNMPVYSATVDMSLFGAGAVRCILRLAASPYTQAWTDTIQIDGSGNLVDLSSPSGIRAALGMAAADLDTQLSALPTAVEIRTEIDSNSTSIAAVDAAIGALNDLDAAGVRAAVGLAAADLDSQLAAIPDAAGIRTAVGLESANLSHLVNAIVGKNNVTDNGDGTYNIAVRNAADSATLVTIQYNPTTGTKTIV